jgi:hypothetical protein
MTKATQIILEVSLLILLIGLIYYQGEKYGSNFEINKQQEQQIIIRDDIIKTKDFQQRIVKKSNTSNDSTSRLKWLQLVWQKRNDPQR